MNKWIVRGLCAAGALVLAAATARYSTARLGQDDSSEAPEFSGIKEVSLPDEDISPEEIHVLKAQPDQNDDEERLTPDEEAAVAQMLGESGSSKDLYVITNDVSRAFAFRNTGDVTLTPLGTAVENEYAGYVISVNGLAYSESLAHAFRIATQGRFELEPANDTLRQYGTHVISIGLSHTLDEMRATDAPEVKKLYTVLYNVVRTPYTLPQDEDHIIVDLGSTSVILITDSPAAQDYRGHAIFVDGLNELPEGELDLLMESFRSVSAGCFLLEVSPSGYHHIGDHIISVGANTEKGALTCSTVDAPRVEEVKEYLTSAYKTVMAGLQ